MKFDAVDSESTFSNVSFNSDFNAKVRINPVKRVTGEISTQTFLGTTGTAGIDVASTSIGGIDFGIEANKPALDFNHEGISSVSNNSQINSGPTMELGDLAITSAVMSGLQRSLTVGDRLKSPCLRTTLNLLRLTTLSFLHTQWKVLILYTLSLATTTQLTQLLSTVAQTLTHLGHYRKVQHERKRRRGVSWD